MPKLRPWLLFSPSWIFSVAESFFKSATKFSLASSKLEDSCPVTSTAVLLDLQTCLQHTTVCICWLLTAQCRKASSLWESWSVSSMDIAPSSINAPPSVWLKWLKHCALQKTLSDTSPPQPPITLMTQVFKPLRGILFKSLSPLSAPLLLPLHFVFLIHLMSQTCFLFMTVDDWGALLRCQLCSRGELSRTRTNKNYHLLRGVRLTLDGMSVWVCVSVCECVYSPLPQGRHLILAASGG